MSHDIDTRLRTAWHGARDTLTPGVQRRLREARHAALAGSAPRKASTLRRVGVPAGAFAAIAAIALLAPRLQAPPEPARTATAAAAATPEGSAGPARAPVTEGAPRPVEDVESLAIVALEDDPEFFLRRERPGSAPHWASAAAQG